MVSPMPAVSIQGIRDTIQGIPIFTCWKPECLVAEPEPGFSLDIHNLRITNTYLKENNEKKGEFPLVNEK